MKRRFLRNAALALLLMVGGTIAGLALAELLVALCCPQKVRVTRAAVNFFVQYDPELGWTNRKGASGTVNPPDTPLQPTQVTINADGFRGKPVPLPKPPGRKRILFLGDSNTFGYGVAERDRFSDLLEHRLRGYDGVNLGVFGYGTDQEAILLERDAMRFSPDLVVLAFSPGDLTDNMCSIHTGISKPYLNMENGKLAVHNIPVPAPGQRALVRDNSAFRDLLYRHSHLYRLLTARLNGAGMFLPDSVFEMSKEEGLQVTIAIIEGMNRVCRENGSRLALFLLSHGDWVDALVKDRSKAVGYYPALIRMLQSRGIIVIDSTDAFVAERNNGKKVFFDSDPVHLNREGNRVAAEALLDGLIRNKLTQ